MSDCLVPEIERQIEAARRCAARLIGVDVESIKSIGDGRNSRVYRVVVADRRRFALKAYFRYELEPRDRLKVEFEGLGFLWRHGVRSVPQPLFADALEGFALYEYVEGERLADVQMTGPDIDAAVAFLRRLKVLTAAAGSESLPRASEACFSGAELMANLQARLDRLVQLSDSEPDRPPFRAFLQQELIPAFGRITAWCRHHLAEDRELPREQQTLSPSDFGFHNALRRTGGEWVFVDFEYFGWDDPVKTISDFLLHPAMDLGIEFQRRFVAGMLGFFDRDRQIVERLKSMYPLFGLKWCLILLNEFLPAGRQRRQFAAGLAIDREAVEAEQLAKSRRMLQRIVDEHEQNSAFE